MRPSSLLAALVLLLLLGAFPFLKSDTDSMSPPGDAAEEKSEEKIEQWVKDLGSESFAKREVATRALMDLEVEPPRLRRELKSADPEVRRRAAKVLEAYVPKRAKKELAKVKVLAKEGRVDEMAERLVLWRKYDTGEGWKALVELAARLATRADFTYDKTHFRQLLKPEERGESKELVYDKTTFQFVNKPLEGMNLTKEAKEKLISKNLAKHWQSVLEPVRDEGIAFDQRQVHGRMMIIASGDVDISGHMGEGIIVAGRNLRLKEVAGAVVICDGECEIRNPIMQTFIVARGKVTCFRGVSCNYSVVLSENFIDGVQHLRLSSSVLSSNAYANTNGFVKFFNPYDVGISAWNVLDKEGKVIPDGTQIFEVREGTPFASRLQAKDLVTAIDETKTPTFEAFRRALRRKLAEGVSLITFTVRRADKTLGVPIVMKD